MKKCSVSQCSNQHSAKSYCNKHYQRLLKYGDAEHKVRPTRIPDGTCTVVGCDKPIRNSRGWCNRHYMKWYRHGDPSFEMPKGVWNTNTYKIWVGMKQRCDNPNSQHYDKYGGRGIKYDKRWKEFRNFLEDMGWRPEGLSLDRIDNDGDYTKDNCRWTDNITQQNNTRSNIRVTYDGKTLTLAQWDRDRGLPPNTVWWRIKKGWSIDDAIDTPLKVYKNTRLSSTP